MCRYTSCNQNGAANNRVEGFCSQQIPCNTEDGAPAHLSVAVPDRLREVFGNHIIALNYNNELSKTCNDAAIYALRGKVGTLKKLVS